MLQMRIVVVDVYSLMLSQGKMLRRMMRRMMRRKMRRNGRRSLE